MHIYDILFTMNIYVAHSRNFDFKSELYQPLRGSELNDTHNFVLPHEHSDEPFTSKDFLQDNCDVMIAEVSSHATGIGIEVGWADAYNVRIICVYKTDSNLSGSLKVVCDTFVEYQNPSDLINKLSKIL